MFVRNVVTQAGLFGRATDCAIAFARTGWRRLKMPHKWLWKLEIPPQMIFRHYRQLVTEAEAQKWFAIAPDASANVITLAQPSAA